MFHSLHRGEELNNAFIGNMVRDASDLKEYQSFNVGVIDFETIIII